MGKRGGGRMMATCQKCGCTKPCGCDGYTPDYCDRCMRCGCTKPCGCDNYTRRGEWEVKNADSN